MSSLTANFEDVYPLTPFQQGMLFHVLDTPEAGVYLNQQRYTLRGDLDLAAFKQALQGVLDRHQILRTAFVLSAPGGPLQVVFRRLQLPWTMHDWSDLPPAESAERLAVFMQTDFQSGFDLQKAPLMRTTLIRTETDTYEFVWSFHLLLMDGWSMQVMLRELLALYHGIVTGQPVELAPPVPYRDFIKWLQQQSEADAEVYWRKTLTGFTRPTPLNYDRTPMPDVSEQPNFKETIVYLDEYHSENLQKFSTLHRLTLNTIIQGAWALFLSRRSGTNDVLFASVVSGRSAVIPRIDSAVGVFVNALPARVKVPTGGHVVAWLKEIQKQQAEARRFEFCSLVRIQSWSEVPRSQPLFESVVIFQNLPRMVSMPDSSSSVQVAGVSLIERNNVPLALVVEPGDRFHFRLVYMGSRFDDATIDRMLENFKRIIIDLTNNSDAALSSISYQVDTERQLLIDSFNQSLASL
ncbi:MAG TPA: condensation domain-containing protein [Pyrinomonadaceae bacterium]|nr:condensation domain-containing protein [Pyrinomonadaceae bacterium]